MSFIEKNGNKIFMNENLFQVPTPLQNEFDKAREEKEAKELSTKLLELEKAKQAEINEKISRLELLPIGNKIIVLPYPENPYRKVMEGSFIVDYKGEFKNPDTGEMDKLQQGILCAKVIEIGSDCKYVKVGDDVYYDHRSAISLPFMTLGYFVTYEPSILCVMNEGLKERFKNVQ